MRRSVALGRCFHPARADASGRSWPQGRCGCADCMRAMCCRQLPVREEPSSTVVGMRAWLLSQRFSCAARKDEGASWCRSKHLGEPRKDVQTHTPRLHMNTDECHEHSHPRTLQARLGSDSGFSVLPSPEMASPVGPRRRPLSDRECIAETCMYVGVMTKPNAQGR